MILDIKKQVSYYKDNLFPKFIVSQHIEGDSKKGQRKLILGVTLAIIIFVSTIAYFFVMQPSNKPPPEIILTKEQKEVDDFLKEYYFAYGNVSINRIIPLFDSEAILSAPDGSVYRGTENLRSYYSNLFANFESFTIVKTIVKIEVRSDYAQAVYDIRMRIWRFGATEPPQLFTRDDFGLKKKDDKWSISGLVIEQTSVR